MADVHKTTDALIATPIAKTVKDLRAAVSAIKKVYYAPLGDPRRRKLRVVLDANYAALTPEIESSTLSVGDTLTRCSWS